MKRRKQFLSVVLSVVMLGSSLQFPGMTLQAKELSEEATVVDDTTDKQESEEQDETEETKDAEQSESEDAEDQLESKHSEEADTLENSDTENEDKIDIKESDTEESETVETEIIKVEATETETSEIETTEEETESTETEATEEETESTETQTNEEETNVELEIVQAELDGVYQFGGAPSGKVLSDEDSIALYADETNVEEYIYQQMLERNTNINIADYSISTDQIGDIVKGLINEHPELYFVNKGWKWSYSPTTNIVVTLSCTYDTTLNDADFKRETQAALANIKSGMTDLQKAIVLHDYIAVNCEYDYDNYLSNKIPSMSYSAYGALVNRIAVCEGYALAYKYLLNQVGIDCYMVSSNAMNHAWNLIKLDGQYYQVDVTWDDPTWDLIGRVLHTNMFRSDDKLEKHHDWIVTIGASTVDYKATDTRYDEAFWKDTNAPLIFTGNNWEDCYYINKTAYSINKTALSNNASNIGDSICSIDKWTSWNNEGNWSGVYSGLYQLNNRLYYNDKSAIYSIAFDGSDKKTEFEADTTNGYIYGSALCQGKVLYSLHQEPNLSAKEEVLEASFEIQEPEEPEKKDPYIKAVKTKTEYESGETIELTDLTVTYYDETGKSETVTDYTTNIEQIDMTTSGKKELVITYKSLTTTIELTVTEKVKEEDPYIKAEKTQTEYETGDKLNVDDLTVTYYDKTGNSQKVTSYTTNAQEIDMTTPGKKNLVVTYENLTVTIEITVTVKQPAKQDPYIKAEKTQTKYETGDKLDLSDLTVTYYNETGKSETVTDYTTNVQEIDMTTPGKKNLVVTYENLTVTIEITVTAKQPVKKDPYLEAVKTKTNYEVGEKLDLSDLTVTYYDETGSDKAVTDYTANSAQIDMTTPGRKELVITYNNVTATISLTVTEKPAAEEPMQTTAVPTTSHPSGTVARGTRISLSTATEGADIYYTTDNTEPNINSRRYTEPITVDRNMTIKAYAVKSGYKDSDVAQFQYTISENREGLKVELAEPNRVYIYTGSAITPKIIVTNNGILLKEGTDYSVKYTNNINASDNAKITVTGKNNLTGNKTIEFAIKTKRIDNSDVDANNTMRIEGDSVSVVENSKVSPVLLYGSNKLTSKDFKLSDDGYKSYKWKAEDNNKTISVTGQGNFTGTRTLTVKVMSKAQQSQSKIIVNLDKEGKNFTYDGLPKDIRSFLSVSTKGTPSGLEENVDYMISYPQDITNAGTKKFTVVGISERCTGTVTKSYTIKPKKTGFKVSFNDNGYPYISTGSTISDLTVRDDNKLLTENIDYKVSYSNNKKVGTAKFTVTGLGSYKGNTYKGTFTINPVSLNSDTVKIVVGDKVFGKPGVYRSTPYVSINDVAVKTSDYTVTYYLDDPRTNSEPRIMDNKNNKVTNQDGDTKVWVKVVGKNNGNFGSGSDSYAVADYMVRSKTADSFDLSKAKVTFQDINTGKTIKKMTYTGNPVTNIKVVVKSGNVTLDESKYTVSFTNNVNKGKATVMITGKEGQNEYVGSRTATFQIVASNVDVQ